MNTAQRGYYMISMVFLMLLLSAPSVTVPPPEAVQTCREAAGELASGLMKELTAAMTAGGAPAALSVCREKAPAIAAALSREKGLTVRRTALKVRNPENRPDEWEVAVLKEFERRLAAGEDPAAVEHAEVVTAEGKRAVRFMRAIPAKEACLQCHGDPAAMNPEVRAAVVKLYPDDAAVGFRAGDLRGAFSVTHPLP
jgi:hypothetical protein